jgi:hypothetical protein
MEIRERARREVTLIQDRIRAGVATARTSALAPAGWQLLDRIEAALA